MYYTGFADEAARDIEGQIKATKELGWSRIESRKIGGANIHDMPQADFEVVVGKLSDAGITINCFGSAVANWAKDPTKPEDIQKSSDELDRALARMDVLGTKLIRGMSFKMMKDRSPHDTEIHGLVIKNLSELVKRCENAGVTYLHENCMNYGGQSPQHSLQLIEEIDSPNFKLLFDPGNPPLTDNRQGDGPYSKQSSWDFYQTIKEQISYVHIKDCILTEDKKDALFPPADFTWPGEGNGNVREILTDLFARGYDGPLSIEPHRDVVFHEEDNDGAKAETLIANYVEYGKRLMAMVDEIRGS